ncbi:MAG: hypothetical protein M1480_12555 [Bacteroidetes bacterium]|nr:hypothetical protein [Bacteroidota bacterium]
MKKIFISIIFLCTISFPQENNSSAINLFSPINTKKFADYLFCQHDYLRAIEEYNRYLLGTSSDSIKFRIAIAYSKMGDYKQSIDEFMEVPEKSQLSPLAKLEIMKSLFQSGNFNELRNYFNLKISNNNFNEKKEAKSLYNFSFLFTNDSLPTEHNFYNAFHSDDLNKIKKFYNWKKDPPEKKSLTAGILSAIIPGAGKIYTNQFWDGLWAFITSVGFTYLSYDNFHAGHYFRGWLFGGLAVGFYAGNVYGSAASAQIYNAKIHFDFVNDLKDFLESHNYFIPVINFCK